MLTGMLRLRAHVENGRVIVDDTVDPAEFPDGTELQLVPDDECCCLVPVTISTCNWKSRRAPYA